VCVCVCVKMSVWNTRKRMWENAVLSFYLFFLLSFHKYDKAFEIKIEEETRIRLLR
jgi:hypothetical protein